MMDRLRSENQNTMITKQKALFYYVGDEVFPSLEEAQKCDLKKLVPDDFLAVGDAKEKVADWMLKNSVAIVDILTTTPSSRSKARKANGAKRAKKAKAQPALADAPPSTPTVA